MTGSKKGRGLEPPPLSDQLSALFLPIHPDADAQHARREDGTDIVGGRAVLHTLQRLNRIRVHHVEHVHRRDETDRAEFHRTLDVEVEVLVVRESVLADVVQQDRRDARTVCTRWALDRRFERVALPRVVKRR